MRPAISKTQIMSVLLLAVLVLIFVWNRERTAPRRHAQELWHQHERVISDAATGKRVDLDDFDEAVYFFEKLTNIVIPSNHSTYIESMPTKDTGAALEPLRRWYSNNKNRLYWDKEHNEVRLAPE